MEFPHAFFLVIGFCVGFCSALLVVWWVEG